MLSSASCISLLPPRERKRAVSKPVSVLMPRGLNASLPHDAISYYKRTQKNSGMGRGESSSVVLDSRREDGRESEAVKATFRKRRSPVLYLKRRERVPRNTENDRNRTTVPIR